MYYQIQDQSLLIITYFNRLCSIVTSNSPRDPISDIRFELKDQYQFDLRQVDYTLSFNAVGNVGLSNNALLGLFFSCSSMKPNKELFFNEYDKEKVKQPIWKKNWCFRIYFYRRITKRL